MHGTTTREKQILHISLLGSVVVVVVGVVVVGVVAVVGIVVSGVVVFNSSEVKIIISSRW